VLVLLLQLLLVQLLLLLLSRAAAECIPYKSLVASICQQRRHRCSWQPAGSDLELDHSHVVAPCAVVKPCGLQTNLIKYRAISVTERE
jgi:hypothetical protein